MYVFVVRGDVRCDVVTLTTGTGGVSFPVSLVVPISFVSVGRDGKWHHVCRAIVSVPMFP